ncbi:MAG: glycerophosphodiester phosphodiesterase [Acutalibacteraceae bacterium]
MMNKKKALILGGAALAAAFIGACCLYPKAETYTLPQGFTVTAHTGCEGTEDNSLESIKAGIEKGADIVEIDLQFSAYGTPVLCHDTPAGDEPTLDSAFEILSVSDVKMNVDMKSSANLKEVVSLAKKHGVSDKIFFTGVEEKDVDTVKKDVPEIPYYLNLSVEKGKCTDKDYIDSLIERVKQSGAIGINMNYKGASAELVEAFHGQGLLVSLWTANSKLQMKKCLKVSPDNITTRKPSVLLNVIGKDNK